MRRRHAATRVLAVASLLAATCAAIPAVRWCPIRWDQIRVAAWFRCDAGLESASWHCSAALRAVARDEHARADAAHAGGTACTPACERATGDAATCERCPIPSSEGGCPVADTGAAPAPGGTSSGRAYCLGDPAIARGLIARGLHVDAPVVLATLVPVAPAVATPVSRPTPRAADDQARPPTRHQAARPPVRAPPTLA